MDTSPSTPPAAGMPVAPRFVGTRERWLRWVERPGRETAVVTAFFLLLTVAVFASVLFGPGTELLGDSGADMARQFVHWRAYGFDAMAAGHLPLWNPHIYGGTQYFGGFQSALLYPPNWLYLCLPLVRAVNVGIALHVFLAGWFTYFWARHRGLHVVAAVLSGVLFMFSGAYFLHIFAGHLPNLCTMVWGPLILLAIDGWCARRTSGWLLLGGGALAMQILAGHPQYVFYTGVAAALYSVTKLWPDPRRLWTALGLAAIPAIGVALSAAQLFEGIHASGESLRARGTTINFAASFSFPPENLITLVAPGFFGNIVDHPYWGRQLLWEMCPFVGVAGLVLAVYAVCSVRRREVWVCSGLALTLFVIALGRHTPLFELLYYYAPGFNKFRGWSKFIYPATLFVVMLAGLGFDDLLRRERIPRALGIIVLGSAILLLGAGVWAHWSAHEGAATSPQPWDYWLHASIANSESVNEWMRYLLQPPYIQGAARRAAQALYLSAGTFFILAAALEIGRRRREVLFAVPVIALAEMLVFAAPNLVTFTYAPVRRDAIVEYLNTHPVGDGRILDLDDPNTGMTDGGSDLWGYDPGVTRRYAEFINVTQHVPPERASQDVRFRAMRDIYATLLRVRGAWGYVNGAENRITTHIFDDKLVAPHAMIVPRVQIIPDDEEVLKAMLPPFDPRGVVILQSAPDPAPAPNPAPGKVAVTEETNDSLTLEADLPDPALVVITDAYSDGWQATSLLRPGEGSGQTHYNVMPADYCVRGIPMAAGHHRLRLDYWPRAFVLGAWVSGISLLLCLAFAVWLVVRARGKAGMPTARETVASSTPG